MTFVYITQYYTEYKYRPVRSIAIASQTGLATNMITGFAVTLDCTATLVLVIAMAIIGSYYLGQHSGVTGAGLFGTAVASMGMLVTFEAPRISHSEQHGRPLRRTICGSDAGCMRHSVMG
jgi:K(+)-stimulated pyrophosphate-energized sodium pump